ncbi:unnamed protein product [Didymodactylos carnosus]|uniref:Uncharacterized protein n=1 Tax=Didymodactylos carnosus TaxID=1234261 RepID=A0A8S2R620_9BILA|nr:unnamed protein product [Didymodactylos carnosus]CAF4142563.1 unnamed protein product [Didymodactylos carnosus]
MFPRHSPIGECLMANSPIFLDIRQFVNENEYKKLDENFRKLLPKTRFNLIKCQINSNNFQSICKITKSIKEFQTFLNLLKSRFKEINRKILQLILLRANIYRKNHYFYLEELEFLTILTHQQINIDHNPMIYYRLSYLYKLKGDLQMAIHYINLASQKYNEKNNKKIFKKNGKINVDFDYNIDLTDTLNYFKKLFCESIEEYHKEIEEIHKSALELIDNLIEQHENKQKYFHLLNRFKEGISKNLSIYENVSLKSEKSKNLTEIISSIDDIDVKLRKSY